jgi:diguanylate cyclase (GGDEF)-like protein/PAS domain S-box-containing protein
MARDEDREGRPCEGFAAELSGGMAGGEGLGQSREVAHLVRARWVIVFILFLYAVYAGLFYSLSRFGFFLGELQVSFLLLCLCAVVTYNLAYQDPSSRLSRFRYADHLQVFLDQLLVTVLIHFSGGAVSWVWTLYLLVTMEAVYLLKRRSELWCSWGVGGLLYGVLLAGEHTGVIGKIAMPFVDSAATNDLGFLLLNWLWVVLLNFTVCTVGFRVASLSRGETRQLRESRQRLFALLEHAEDLIQLNRPDGTFIYANRSWLKTMGYDSGELQRLNLFNLLHEDCRAGVGKDFRKVLGGGGSGALDALYLSRDGRQVNVEGYLSCSFRGQERDAVWTICRDVTLKKRADEELYRMAHHDVLTDLPNRQLFMDRLQQLRGMMTRMGRSLAVLYLDLDHFKNINDTLGHAFGDRLLQEVAVRLAGAVRETDTVARFGGDEFVIALGNLRELSGAEKVAQKIQGALRAPYQIDCKELLITSSIGISIFPEDGSELGELVEKADLALYWAKEDGRGCYRIHSQGRKPAVQPPEAERLLELPAAAS